MSMSLKRESVIHPILLQKMIVAFVWKIYRREDWFDNCLANIYFTRHVSISGLFLILLRKHVRFVVRGLGDKKCLGEK
ncbi:hypothetical protein QJS04_geneDACA010899 [Acorus gramineus]|uniref:Uncharacterized protein n=1 Tax=Acorus gramineus TaxID=55184 RepID=A0AAV9BD78_ACOGR|nr:hypothetical protein QJS04_geneDACA010899 [Acorus gramineus]